MNPDPRGPEVLRESRDRPEHKESKVLRGPEASVGLRGLKGSKDRPDLRECQGLHEPRGRQRHARRHLQQPNLS